MIGEPNESSQFSNRRKWSRVRGSNPPFQPYESRPLPCRGPAKELVSAAGLEPAITGIKIRRLGQLGDAPHIWFAIWSCQREFNPRSPALRAPYPWLQAMAGWRGRPGSNRTPPVWKTGTQPTTPRPQDWNSRNKRGRRRCSVWPALSVLHDPIDRDGIAHWVRAWRRVQGSNLCVPKDSTR
jgi:hypothetical protein